MNPHIPFDASKEVAAVIRQLGRTEDVVFSPSNRRMAIAGFRANRIAVFDISVAGANGTFDVSLPRVVELDAPFLNEPHGICFLGENMLAVANRTGLVHLIDAPLSGSPHDKHSVASRMTIAGSGHALVHTPGSVAAIAIDADSFELMVCNNYVNHVTRHIVHMGKNIEVTADELAIEAGLDVPDGISHSPDGRWIAVSNHNTHSVFVYARTPALNRVSAPDAVLRNVLCPHGVRFTPDGRFILVADAGAPYVNVYKRGQGDWHGTYDPYSLFPVMEPAVFATGRHNPQEGGPKGIDLDKNMTVLVATCESQTLAFFDLAQVLSRRRAPENRHKRYVQWRLENALHRRHPDVYGRLMHAQAPALTRLEESA